MEPQTIGQRIAAQRRKLGLSQSELGEQLGVSRQAISKWESDGAIPDVDKLIALGKLFGVRVGWILGVEEETARESSEGFSERERALLELLTKPRPAPLWLKLSAGTIAAVMAISLISNAVVIAENRRRVKELAQLFEYATRKPLELADYQFTILPDADLTQFQVTLQVYLDGFYEDMTAALQVMQNSKEVTTVPCVWDGEILTAELTLPAEDGYQCHLLLTTPEGTQSAHLRDTLLSCLGSSKGSSTVSARAAFCSYDGKNLVVENLRVIAELPAVWKDVPQKWTQCDLVVVSRTREQARIDLLHRSEYAEQMDFTDIHVDFTTRRQSAPMLDLPVDADIELWLECTFWNGETQRVPVGSYYYTDLVQEE